MSSDVFVALYASNGWNGVESLSGPGSGPQATGPMAPALLALVKELGVTSVLDVGCGDGYWMPDLPGYLGIDVVPQAITIARRRHPDRSYMLGELRHVDVGIPAMVIVRDVVQHLPQADALALLDEIETLGAKWLLASTYVGGKNVDIAAGDCYSPDMTAPPFDLGEPETLIPDGYHYDGSGTIRDPAKHLGLWRI